MERGSGSLVPNNSAFFFQYAQALTTQELSSHGRFMPDTVARGSGLQSPKQGLCHPEIVIGTQQSTARADEDTDEMPASPAWAVPTMLRVQPELRPEAAPASAWGVWTDLGNTCWFEGCVQLASLLA